VRRAGNDGFNNKQELTDGHPSRRLGPNGPSVSAIGQGCMGMSEFYGTADRTESIATIHAALEAGVTLFDTGNFYGMAPARGPGSQKRLMRP
jgi:diketogulonate reductase-like aldo/keto reductase